jgi:hypothetical protein
MTHNLPTTLGESHPTPFRWHLIATSTRANLYHSFSDCESDSACYTPTVHKGSLPEEKVGMTLQYHYICPVYDSQAQLEMHKP